MTTRRVPKIRAVDIDPERFWGAIAHKRSVDNVSLSHIGRELGITPSTFTRISYASWGISPNYRPDLRTYLSLCWWMGREPGEFIVPPPDDEPTPEPTTETEDKPANA